LERLPRLGISNPISRAHQRHPPPRQQDGRGRVLLTRSYGALIEDVWDALTDPERIRRWLMPITGELKIGGSFQLEGNAGGEILECEPPSRFKVTFGGPTSLVEVRLTAGAEDETTELELDHTVPAEFAGGGVNELSAATEASLAQFAPWRTE
jgi:uncharacterized protein YndB with AHSA1/START domain